MSCEGYALRTSNLISTRARFKKRLAMLTVRKSQPHRLRLNCGRYERDMPSKQRCLPVRNWEDSEICHRGERTFRQERLRQVFTTREQGRGRNTDGMVMYNARGKGGGAYERFLVTEVAQQMRSFLESEQGVAAQAASSLVKSIDPQGRAALLSALFATCAATNGPNSRDCYSWFGAATSEAVDHFTQADVNSDGVLDATEFASYVEAQAHIYGQSNKPLTSDQLFHLSTQAAIGMIGFGFIDNAIMILAGDAIQNTIGLTLGLSTLMSAGLGNAVADLIGTASRGYIERISGKFMPEVQISSRQLESRDAWWAETVGASAGVTLGCLLGLAPLLFLQRLNGTATPDIVLANTNNCSSKSQQVVLCSKELSRAGNNGRETTFASLSTLVPLSQVGVPQKLDGLVLLFIITAALAMKRMQGFVRRRQRKVDNYRQGRKQGS